ATTSAAADACWSAVNAASTPQPRLSSTRRASSNRSRVGVAAPSRRDRQRALCSAGAEVSGPGGTLTLVVMDRPPNRSPGTGSPVPPGLLVNTRGRARAGEATPERRRGLGRLAAVHRDDGPGAQVDPVALV